jgi:hypothetical protein
MEGRKMNEQNPNGLNGFHYAIFVIGVILIGWYFAGDKIKNLDVFKNSSSSSSIQTNIIEHEIAEHTKECMEEDDALIRRELDKLGEEILNSKPKPQFDSEKWSDANDRLTYLAGFYRGINKQFTWPKITDDYAQMEKLILTYHEQGKFLIQNPEDQKALNDQVENYLMMYKGLRSNHNKFKGK